MESMLFILLTFALFVLVSLVLEYFYEIRYGLYLWRQRILDAIRGESCCIH